MGLIARWLVNAVAVAAAAWIVPSITVDGTVPLLVAAVVVGLVNSVLKPVLVVLTLPITVLSLGLFYLVLNGLLFYLAAALTPGFAVGGFWSALLGAIVVSLVATMLHALMDDGEGRERR